ncbi:TIGR00270 family protein [Candidatus Woesearchaeota archaeon]|nr:TIGR00270 family protein [Candidatus Woesearchaeota archaeon]
MPACELCGKQTELVTASVEGADLEVCSNCARHGTIKRKALVQSYRPKPLPQLPEETVVKNFAIMLRLEREKRGLTQEDFAKLLQEKESIVTKWESGSLLPEVAIAKKLEKILGLSVVEIEKREALLPPKLRNDVLTLGDMIKVRKRK